MNKPRKKKGIVLLFFGVFFFSLFLFRTPILKGTLALFLPSSVTFDKVEWVGGHILAHGIDFHDDGVALHVDRAELKFQPAFKPLFLELHLSVSHPELVLDCENNTPSAFPAFLLIPQKFLGVKLQVEHGVLNLCEPSKVQRYFFTFEKGETREEIGRFSLSSDPSLFHLPLLHASFTFQEKELTAYLKTEGISTSSFSQLISAFYPPLLQGWKSEEGLIELETSFVFSDDFSLKHLSGEIEGHSLSLVHPVYGVEFEAKEIQGKFILPEVALGKNEIVSEWSLADGLFYFRNTQQEMIKVISGAKGHAVVQSEKPPELLLEGVVHCNQELLALKVTGKGELQKEGPFWGELEVSLGSEKEPPMHALLSVCHPQKDEYVVQAEIKEIGSKLLSLLSAPFALKIHDGILEGKATAHIKNGIFHHVSFEEASIDHLSFSSSEVQGEIEHLMLDGELSYADKNWNFKRLQMHSHQGVLKRGTLELKQEDFLLSLLDQKIEKFFFKGLFQETALQIEALKSPSSPGQSISGKLMLADSCHLDFGCDLEPLKFAFNLSPLNGWFHGNSSKEYLKLVTHFFPEIQVQGELDLLGTFNKEKIKFSIQSDSLHIHHALAEVQLDHIGVKDPLHLKKEGKASLTYNFSDGKFQGIIPILQGRILEKKKGLQVQKIQGTCHLSNSGFILEDAKGECDGVQFQGKVSLIDQDLILETTSFSGPLPSFYHLLTRFASLPNLGNLKKGQISCQEGGFTFFARIGEENTAWRFKGKLHDAEIVLSPKATFKDLSWEVEADSHAQKFTCVNGRGVLQVEGAAPYQLDFPELVLTKEKGTHGLFDLRLTREKKESLRLCGRVQGGEGGEVLLLFDPGHSHFFQTKMGSLKIVLKDDGSLLFLDGRLLITAKELNSQLEFLNHCGLISVEPSLFRCESECDVRLHYREFFSFEAEGKKLILHGKSYNSFAVEGEKHGNEWVLKKVQLDGIIFEAILSMQNEKISIPSFELRTDSSLVQGQGIYENKRFIAAIHSFHTDLGKLNFLSQGKGSFKGKGKVTIDLSSSKVEGELGVDLNVSTPFSLSSKTEKNFQFVYSPDQGLRIEDLEFQFPSHSLVLHLEKLSLSQDFKKGEIKRANLEGKSPLFGAKAWDIQQLVFSNEKKGWQLDLKTALENQSLFLHGHMDAGEKKVFIVLKENPKNDGLKIIGSLDGKWQFQSISGKFSGLESDLIASSKQENCVAGSLKIDFKRLAPYFSKELKDSLAPLALGKGYELQGDFFFPKEGESFFRGKLLGNQFECSGMLFESMHAQAEISASRFSLRQLTLTDRSGKMEVKHLKIDKRPITNTWTIDVPHIQVSEFSPSLLRKEKGASQEVKPLLVGRFTLSDLKGELNKPQNLKAHGELHFSNSSKKQQSLLDLPFEFIKDFGLDPNLMVPVYGEIQFELQGGKFYLTEMTNVFSDAQRSQFFLAEDRPSFVDLKGNINVDIKMKQNVTLKLVEPFIFKVRGTLENPKIRL
jgi:hypothetical protein